MIVKGRIQIIQPTSDEIEDNDHLNLPRIGFNFNRRNYGRLRRLIDVLNEP